MILTSELSVLIILLHRLQSYVAPRQRHISLATISPFVLNTFVCQVATDVVHFETGQGSVHPNT
jgi:hypothetical protein